MKFVKHLLGIVCIAFLIVGCSSTGGIIGGLVPAPKFTKGELSDGVYLAQDKSFSVNSPFDKDSYEYTYMAIAEHYSDTENRVQFSSSAAPAEVYRINIFKNIRPEENLNKVAFEQYRQQMELAYKTTFKNLQTKDISISGIPATVSTYSQHIPERSSLGQTAQKLDVLHSCLYLEKMNNSAFICVNRIEPEMQGSSEGSEIRLDEFIKSFQLK